MAAVAVIVQLCALRPLRVPTSDLHPPSSDLGPPASFLDRPPRTVAGVHHSPLLKDVHGFPVHGLTIALTTVADAGAEGVGVENVGAVAEPIEIVQDAGLVIRTAAFAIVVLDPEQDFPAGVPHVFGVQDVAEMQPSGGSRREAGSHSRSRGSRYYPRLWTADTQRWLG